jgi:hypothetical protein
MGNKDMVPFREMKTFQTDDGRRIEVFYKMGEVSKMKSEEDTDIEFIEEPVYIGVVHIMTDVGPKEIKFEIGDATSVEDAFEKYQIWAEKSIEEIKARFNEARSRIIQAPADALNMIDNNKSQIII